MHLSIVKTYIYKSKHFIEFVSEQSEKGPKTVPTYIKDIQDEFFLEGEDDEIVQVDRGRHSASTSTVGRQVVPANVSLSNKLQVPIIPPTQSQVGDYFGRQTNTNAGEGHGRNFQSNYPPSTKRLEPSKRIVFPKDVVDKNRRNYRKERTSSNNGKNYSNPTNPANPTTNRNYSDFTNFDDWVPLTGFIRSQSYFTFPLLNIEPFKSKIRVFLSLQESILSKLFPYQTYHSNHIIVQKTSQNYLKVN